MKFWTNKNVLVTGGYGFIGTHLVPALLDAGAHVTIFDNLSNSNKVGPRANTEQITFIDGDCRDLNDATKACKGIDIVMNLAAKISGVEYNIQHPGTMLAQNLMIETAMTEAARSAGVRRFLAVSSAVVYPSNAKIPTNENEGFTGNPDEPNKGYGWAKRMAELLGKYYHEEFGMEVAVVRPYNCYGPGDHFFPKPSHVIPSLIRRVVDGENPVIVWGSGNQMRAFLYVDDLVRGMMLAIEKYTSSDPVNLGTDEEVTIRELIGKIIKISGKNPKVIYDRTKPDGSPRRNCDNTKAKNNLGFTAKTSLDEGLKKTITWYVTMKNSKDKLHI